MESINIAGINLQFDRSRTAKLLEQNSNRDWCQCDGCTSSRIATRLFMPPIAKELLATLEIDADSSFHREGKRPRRKDGWYWSISYWPIIGVLDGQPQEVEIATDTTLSIGPEFTSRYDGPRILEQSKLDREDNILFVTVRTLIPWIADEFGDLRSESHCPQCVFCGHSWRWTGYFRRGSRIADWYGMPEIETAFRRPKSRVLISLCQGCGDLQYRVVPDKPPFRKKSQWEKTRKKEMKRFMKLYGPQS